MAVETCWRKPLLLLVLNALTCGGALGQSTVPDEVIAKAVRAFQIPPATSAKSYGNAPASPVLLDLAEDAANKSWTPESGRRSKNGVVLDDGLANITITSLPGRMADLKARLAQLGGSIQAELEGRLYARLAPAQFQALLDSGAVKAMVPQREHLSDAAPVGRTGFVGEGLQLARIEALHRAGLTGKGVTIGVLDLGYHRYDELVRKGELPKPADFRVFSQRPGTGTQVHGTACAEIIHDVAPDARLVIAQVGPGIEGRGATDAEVIEAARWLEAQGVDIISGSFGGISGANDGSDHVDRMVDAMSQREKLWVMAAGNSGAEHWGSEVRDDNRDGLVDIPGSRAGDVLVIRKGERGPLSIVVKWSDWAGQARAGDPQDIDLVLVKVQADGTLAPVAELRRPRTSIDVEPLEVMNGDDVTAGTYALLLLPTRITRAVNVHVFVRGAELMNINPSGSIGSPGSARLALTVGAVHAKSGRLEAYSSQGPTDDGRTKPEIVAPANMTSVSYGGRSFPGTSAAAPHAAGFAALLKQANPQLSGQQLRQRVIESVSSAESDTPNSRTGYGLIDGARAANSAAVSAAQPSEGAADQILAPMQDMLRKR
jgi:subtilisin family serine protease